jgi:hypothetical protein
MRLQSWEWKMTSANRQLLVEVILMRVTVANPTGCFLVVILLAAS